MLKFFKVFTLFSALILALYVGGFFLFSENLPKPHKNYNVRNTDGLIVFTGGSKRIEAAISMILEGYEKPVLISGVHPSVTMDILFADVPAEKRELITLDYASRSTSENALTTRQWSEENNMQTIGLITSYYHVPRSLLYIERTGMTKPVKLLPVYPEHMPFSFMLREYHKYLLTKLYVL